jgi:hypothetical protein
MTTRLKNLRNAIKSFAVVCFHPRVCRQSILLFEGKPRKVFLAKFVQLSWREVATTPLYGGEASHWQASWRLICKAAKEEDELLAS